MMTTMMTTPTSSLTSLTVAGLAFAVLLSGSAPVDAQEEGEGHGDCVTHEERRSDDDAGPGLQLAGGEPSPGYHGIIYGGEVSLESLEEGGPVRWKDHPVVDGVYCGSPAHEAGLQVDDVIVAVNGADARRPDLLKATEPGMRFRLIVRRGGEQLRFEIRTVRRPPEAR